MAGYGITSNDMEASRLVFVSVKDAKPRRKVAIPLPDGMTWDAFLQQVQTKLRLVGVESITLALSGERVTRLDDLQDIDELHVVEAPPPSPVSAAAVASGGNGGDPNALPAAGSRPNGGAGPAHGNGGADSNAGPYRQSDQRHRVGVADAEIRPMGVEGADDDADNDAKYVKRQSSLQRSIKRFFPSAFQPTLPVTTRDIRDDRPPAGGSRRKRRHRSIFDPRNLLVFFMLATCLATLLYMFSGFSKLP